MIKNIFSWIRKDFRMYVQKFGQFMSNMIIPVIGVIIAWGLWTSMFLYNSPTSHGWFQVPSLGKLVGPGIKYLIPILIAYTAGKMVYGIRGAMISTFVIVAAIVGTGYIYENFDNVIQINGKSLAGKDPNQIVTSMILGPLSAFILKQIEKLYLTKISSGFEMLVKNFSLALIAIVLGIGIFFGWGWVLFGITLVMTSIVNSFGTNRWIAPLLTIFTEPIRTIFLNNALNHGVMSPIGFTDILEQKSQNVSNPSSIFFLFGGNPGPGFGLLVAYAIWRKGTQRSAALGSSVIQLLGGIHEVYYVFVLQAPIMIFATIPGQMASMTIFSFLNGGTSATVSPGSLISVIAMSPNVYHILINVLGVMTGALVTFVVASIIIKSQKNKNQETTQGSMSVKFTDEGMFFEKQKSNVKNIFDFQKAKKIVVACDAGVGSSAMAASIIKKWVKENNIEIEVLNSSINNLKNDADIVVTMKNFEKIVKQKLPNSYVFSVNQFLGENVYDELYEKIFVLKKNKLKEKK